MNSQTMTLDALDVCAVEHRSHFLATARRVLGDAAAAQDAVQDAMLSAARNLHRFRGDSQLSTWLGRIVINAALTRRRSLRRRREESLDSLLEKEAAGESRRRRTFFASAAPSQERLLLGGEITANLLSNPTVTNLAGTTFDMITPGNEMKWDTTQPANNNNFNFGPGDQIVTFAQSKGMRIRGHNLVWHSQLPGWVSSLPSNQVQGAMEAHITTEATHYRRVATKLLHREGVDDATIASMPVGRGFGVRDGNGIIFVSHKGEVNPSGFLPVDVGNVRTESIVDLYRNHPVFTSLRDVDSFKGRCGSCQFAATCGGSRARAYAWTGDYLESDPLCPYVPHENRVRES